ncbi:unnamed protein product [Rotaria sp. Silwood2]|nr:unnamed protein product [Rotaria sp. Silwood2]CAF4224320.1 unnamed protein product [Rotaria sp. Silwood2]CAF4312363.1 unnamed protein product [Rotaria sp. Silwood2]
MSILEQSHSTHRDQTNNIFIRSAVVIGIVIIILLATAFFIYRRLRRSVRHRQPLALQALEASGLNQLHPMGNILMSTLRRLDTLEQATQPPAIRYASSPALPSLKF